MPAEIDPAFTSLPLTALADAGLSRARELGADPRRRAGGADPQPAHSASTTASCSTPATGRCSASRSGSSTTARGASPPVSSSRRTRCAPWPSRRSQWRRSRRPMTLEPIELADEPVHANGDLRVRLRRQPLRDPHEGEGERASSTCSKGILGSGPVQHVAARWRSTRRTSSTRTSRAPPPPSSGCACIRTSRPTAPTPDRHLRLDGHDAGPSRARLRVRAPPMPSTRRWARSRACWPRSSPRRRCGRATTTSSSTREPLAHDPRVDRARHRTRPRARLRGQLRRHQLRHSGQAELAPVRLPGHERHR